LETRNAYRCLVGKRNVKRQLRSLIKMTLREVGYEVANWLSVVQDRAQWRAVVSAAIEVNILVLYLWLFGYATKDSKHFVCSVEL
jgi:L-fucose isomerase-like protein